MTDILALPNWAVLSVERGDELIINAEYQIQPDCCLKCDSESFYKHGPKPISYRDSPVRGSPVIINATLKRYRCRDCSGTFIQPVTGIQPDMRMTERCYDYIKRQSLKDTFTNIANNIGCDDKTVRSIAQAYASYLNSIYEPNEPLIEIILRPNKGLIRRQLILKFNHRCQSCSGIFNSNELLATWLNKDKDYSIENATLLCNSCRERFDSTRS